MNWRFFITGALLSAVIALACLLGTGTGFADNLLQNSSFETDADDDGIPDGWTSHATSVIERVDDTSHGDWAVHSGDAYIVIQQDLRLPEIAGRNLRIKVDAKGTGGAKLGCMIGYIVVGEDGTEKWTAPRMAWDRSLAEEYTTHRFTRQIPENAKGPRLWVCFYRSNRQGEITIDNAGVAMNDLTQQEQADVHRIERGWRYLYDRTRAAELSIGQSPELKEIEDKATVMMERCFPGDRALLDGRNDIEAERAEWVAHLNALICNRDGLIASFTDPYRPLQLDENPPAEPLSRSAVSMISGEHAAVGLLITNSSPEARGCAISLDGIPAGFHAEVRKLGYLENWYRKEHELTPDPLTLLAQDGGIWQLPLASGEIAQLYIGLQYDGAPLATTATIQLTCSGQQRSLPFDITVTKAPDEGLPEVGHISFAYTNATVAASAPDATAADMGAHGVNLMEFAFPPEASFSQQGELLSVDFSNQEKWLTTWGEHIDRMLIFWAPKYDSFSYGDGEEDCLEVMSEPWKRAFTELLTAWFKHAEELGYGMDRFAILPYDEIHSANLDASPDDAITNCLGVMQLLKERFPGLKQALTLTFYTFPTDLEPLLPYVDIAIPHWPMVEQLREQFAPATYNPRQTWQDVMFPMLWAEQQKRGIEVWSYHVAAGKSDDTLLYNRAYPIRAIGAGWTGFGHWAYNVAFGSTWDDTDGKLVDYIFVYDGTENHPTNVAMNPTGEAVVPSIRWEAVRAGQFDARILRYLKQALADGAVPDILKERAANAVIAAEMMAEDDANITWENVSHLSSELHSIYHEMN